jgi:diguanylate cyclase (GGDEF)-like protein
MANIDSLTETVSRAHFLELCQKEINRALRYGRPLSLIIFDIDHFKKINDTFGHQAGDLVLKKLCLICKNKLRDTDFLGRIGGEEFAILSVESDLAGATIAAERLRSEIMESVWEYEGNSIHCTVSFGVAQLFSSGDCLSMLFKRADEALYKAKNLGRNRVCPSAM